MITTIAGTGAPGYAGDDGPRLAAQLNIPRDLEIGPEGDLYIADTDNSVIRAIDLATGMIRTVAGTGELGLDPDDDRPATETKLARPFGIEFDPAGQPLHLRHDQQPHREGDPMTPMTPMTPKHLPLLLLAAAAGCSDDPAPRVRSDGRRHDLHDRRRRHATATTATTAPRSTRGCRCRRTRCCADGTLYILDWNNHRIRKLDADGTIRHVAGRGELGGTLDDPANSDFNHPTGFVLRRAHGHSS